MFTEIKSQAQLDDTIERQPALAVVFWAQWCDPSATLKKYLQLVVKTHPDLAVAKVNFDERPEIALNYDVRSVPTLLVFKSAAAPVKRVAGVPQLADLTQRLEAALANAA